MTDYILEHPNGCMIATYTKGGKLKKIVAKRGAIRPTFVSDAIPQNEKDIDPDKLKIYTPVKDDFFTKAQKAWYEFYTKQSGLEYRFTAADGGALKQIGKHLTNIAGDTQGALEAWQYILHHWNRLDPFYRNNLDVKFINSQLNKILNLLKNGQQTGKGTIGHNADNLRRRFTS